MDSKSIRKTSIALTGIILETLRQFFGQDEIYHYLPVETETKIMIEPAYLWNQKNCQNRPGVYVKREDIAFGPRLGMDDLYSFDIQKGSMKYVVNVNCSMTIFCVCKEPGIAETLATKVADLMICFAPIIKRDFCFDKFGVSRMGAVGQIEESKEFYTVPIQIDGMYDETWTITPEALAIRNIKIDQNVTFSS